MTALPTTGTLRRGDIISLWIFIAAGIAVAGTTIFFAAWRIIDVATGGPLSVHAAFSGTTGTAPIGPDGATRDVIVEQALIRPSTLSPAGVGALVIQQVVLAVTVSALVACLLAVTVSVMRGQVFSQRNTRMVAGAGFAGLAAMFGVPFFGNMVANDAFRDISGGSFNNVVMSADLPALILVGFIVAMATTVFSVGDRLQHETDGLV